jgi:hypothetical protein
LGLGIVSAGIAYGMDFLMAEESSQGIPNSGLPKDKKINHLLKKIIFTTSNKYFSYAMFAF